MSKATMMPAGKICHHTMTGNSTIGELSLEPLITCKLCLCEHPLDMMTTLQECSCIFCTVCLKQYVQLAVREGFGSPITCPDMVCSNRGILQEAEDCMSTKSFTVASVPRTIDAVLKIASLVSVDQLQLYQRLKLEREVHLDPCRTWCPAVDCHTVCQVGAGDSEMAVPVDCPVCLIQFCSACKSVWGSEHSCQDNLPTVVPTEKGVLVSADVDACIKQCPVCQIYIERNEGCAQMMCKNCKHTFCWYCLQNLDNDIFLRHYDKGPCRNKLGHSRASVMWNRTQVVGILVGLGIIAIVTSPLLLLASPCIICCVCKSCRGKKKHGPPPKA